METAYGHRLRCYLLPPLPSSVDLPGGGGSAFRLSSQAWGSGTQTGPAQQESITHLKPGGQVPVGHVAPQGPPTMHHPLPSKRVTQVHEGLPGSQVKL